MFSKMGTKFFTIVLTGIFLVGLSACSGNNSGGEQSDTTLLDDGNSTPPSSNTPQGTDTNGTSSPTEPPQVVDGNSTTQNRPPIAYDANTSTLEETSVALTLGGEDPDGDALSFVLLTQPTHGTLSGTAPGIRYTPELNFNGKDRFTFRVNDGMNDSSPATVEITVMPVNDAPVARDDNATTPEDTGISIDVLANDHDRDGTLDSTTFHMVRDATHGTVIFTDGKASYTPNLNYHGTDSFSYRVKDNEGLVSNEATVTITVNSVNDAPHAQEQNLTTKEDTNLSIVLSGSDEDNDSLTYTVSTQPTHGTLSGTAPHVTYTPTANFNGADRFSFKVNDGTVDSAEATVTIVVTPINDAPVANDDNATTDEDTNLTIDVLGNDRDSDGTLDKSTLTVIKTPAHGITKTTNGKIEYVPFANYNGADTFTYNVQDNEGAMSNEAHVQISVVPVNDAPVARDDNATTSENISIAIDPLLNDTDPDGNVSDLRIVSITQPYSGSALLEGNRVYYAPPSGHAQEDNLTYTIEDKDGGRATGLIRITILPVNEAPIAHNQKLRTPEETPINFELNATDPDGDSLHYHITLFPVHGTLAGDAPSLRYLPNRDYNGEDYIAYTVDDGNLTSSTAVVTIVVDPINDPPIANAGEDATGVRGDTIPFDASGSFDPDGTITSYVWQEGNSTLSTEKIFDRKMLEEGVHTITLTVTDDHNATGSDEKVVTIQACCKGCVYPDPTQTNPFN